MVKYLLMPMLQAIMTDQPMTGLVEVSVYVNEHYLGQGLGSRLYEALERELEARGYLRFLACIALPNPASIALHEKRGYVKVAHFPKVGYKFNQWHDIVWMQKIIDGPVRKIEK